MPTHICSIMKIECDRPFPPPDVHSCPFCGLELDRDHNAAINILNKSTISTVGTTEIEACQGTQRSVDAAGSSLPFRGGVVHVYPCDGCNISRAYEIFEKYKKAFDNEMQGLCLIIADETQKAIGGEVVAGFLCMNGGQRSHWWVEKDSMVFDFMGDVYQKSEFNFHRKEEHRNREIFESLLPRYEKYRL